MCLCCVLVCPCACAVLGCSERGRLVSMEIKQTPPDQTLATPDQALWESRTGPVCPLTCSHGRLACQQGNPCPGNPSTRGAGGLRSGRIQSNGEKIAKTCEKIAMPQPNLPKPQGATLLHRWPLLDLHHLPIAQPPPDVHHFPSAHHLPSGVKVVSLEVTQRTQCQLTPCLISMLRLHTAGKRHQQARKLDKKNDEKLRKIVEFAKTCEKLRTAAPPPPPRINSGNTSAELIRCAWGVWHRATPLRRHLGRLHPFLVGTLRPARFGSSSSCGQIPPNCYES